MAVRAARLMIGGTVTADIVARQQAVSEGFEQVKQLAMTQVNDVRAGLGHIPMHSGMGMCAPPNTA